MTVITFLIITYKDMKKKTFFVLGLAALAMFSCNKATESVGVCQLPEYYARIAADTSKENNSIEIIIRFRIGHNADECDHSCYTAMANQNTHMNCRGRGNACPVEIKIGKSSTHQKTPTFEAEVDSLWEPTTEDYYPVPARSLVVLDAPEGSPYYLNIPEQTLVRDSLTDRFTFTGLFFSETAAYSNN